MLLWLEETDCAIPRYGYVCVYVCLYMHVYAYVRFVCVCVLKHVNVVGGGRVCERPVQICVCMCDSVCVYMCAFVSVCVSLMWLEGGEYAIPRCSYVCVCVFIYMYVCMCVCMVSEHVNVVGGGSVCDPPVQMCVCMCDSVCFRVCVCVCVLLDIHIMHACICITYTPHAHHMHIHHMHACAYHVHMHACMHVHHMHMQFMSCGGCEFYLKHGVLRRGEPYTSCI
jgi:hypothetical protein